MAKSVLEVLLQTVTELPEGSIVWSTMRHSYTREEMMLHILQETDIAKQYGTDVLRVARDIIVRSAKRGPLQ